MIRGPEEKPVFQNTFDYIDNSFSFVQVMPGSSQNFVDLIKFQYLQYAVQF